jgi:hypothetical protein
MFLHRSLHIFLSFGIRKDFIKMQIYFEISFLLKSAKNNHTSSSISKYVHFLLKSKFFYRFFFFKLRDCMLQIHSYIQEF